LRAQGRTRRPLITRVKVVDIRRKGRPREEFSANPSVQVSAFAGFKFALS